MSQFLDEVRIQIHSGDGGNGIVAWRREKYEPLGGPAGGSGGKGASVFLEASSSINTLLQYRYKSRFEAPAGMRGGPKNMHGRDGVDLVLTVPPGTVVTELENNTIIADLISEGDRVMVAAGGRGGRGNAQLSTPTRRAPHFCEPGEPGVERNLKLELKLLADAGLVGLPNAGKSSLLSLLTAAQPKIGDYPFTTLEPNLGVVFKSSGDGYVLADVPGLIEGASLGSGLGHQFLRHLERTRLLVHMVDASQTSLDNTVKTINQELCLYGQRLAGLPQILVLNKMDLLMPEDRSQIEKDFLPRIAAIYQSSSLAKPLEIAAISCATHEGLEQLRNLLLRHLAQLPMPEHLYDVQPEQLPAKRITKRMSKRIAERIPERTTERALDDFSVELHKGRFIVNGARPERLVSVTNLKDPESVHHMYEVLRAMGVVEELHSKGIKSGDEVVVGKTSFEWQ